MRELAPSLIALAVVFVGSAVSFAVAALAARGKWPRRVLAGFAVVFLAGAALWGHGLFPHVLDARFRAFRGLHSRLSPGMAREQVLEELHASYPDGGRRSRPRVAIDEPERLGLFLHPEGASGPDCEAILVDLEDGVVVRVRYSAD